MNHFEYIQNKTQIQQSDVLNTILGALGRNGENANLGLDPIREIGSFADINIKKCADLRRRLSEYKPPLWSKSGLLTWWEMNRTMEFENHRLNLSQADRLGIPRPLATDDLPPQESQTHITDGLVTYGVDPVTRDRLDGPIRFSHQVKLKDHVNCIIISSSSHNFNLYESICKMLESAQELGYDFTQLATLFKLLINKYVPTLAEAVTHVTDYEEIFEFLLSAIDSQNAVDTIKAAIGKVVRRPGDPLKPIIQKLSCLTQELFSEQQYPVINKAKMKERVARKVCSLLPSYISREASKELERYKTSREGTVGLGGDQVTLDECMEFIVQLESKHNYKLKEVASANRDFVKAIIHTSVAKKADVKIHGTKSSRNDKRGRGRSRRSESPSRERSTSASSTGSTSSWASDRSGSGASESSKSRRSSLSSSGYPEGDGDAPTAEDIAAAAKKIEEMRSSREAQKKAWKRREKNPPKKQKEEKKKKDKADKAEQKKDKDNETAIRIGDGFFCLLCYGSCSPTGCKSFPQAKVQKTDCGTCHRGRHLPADHVKKN